MNSISRTPEIVSIERRTDSWNRRPILKVKRQDLVRYLAPSLLHSHLQRRLRQRVHAHGSVKRCLVTTRSSVVLVTGRSGKLGMTPNGKSLSLFRFQMVPSYAVKVLLTTVHGRIPGNSTRRSANVPTGADRGAACLVLECRPGPIGPRRARTIRSARRCAPRWVGRISSRRARPVLHR